MKFSPRTTPLTIGLYLNAVLLIAILGTLLTRSNTPQFLPLALGQTQQPIAGGAGVFIMPAQFSTNLWGCYLMDVDRQTLMVYEYEPGTHKLRMVAGRSIKYDRDVTNLGTYPSPDEIRDWVDRAKNGNRQAPPAGGGAEQPNNGNH